MKNEKGRLVLRDVETGTNYACYGEGGTVWSSTANEKKKKNRADKRGTFQPNQTKKSQKPNGKKKPQGGGISSCDQGKKKGVRKLT